MSESLPAPRPPRPPTQGGTGLATIVKIIALVVVIVTIGAVVYVRVRDGSSSTQGGLGGGSGAAGNSTSNVGKAAVQACIQKLKDAGYTETQGTYEGYAFGTTTQQRDIHVTSVEPQDISPAGRANVPGLEGSWEVQLSGLVRSEIKSFPQGNMLGWEAWHDDSKFVYVRKRSGVLEVRHEGNSGGSDEAWLPPDASTSQLIADGNFCGVG